MRKFRKPLSIVLALMLALSMFSMCATASAAEIDGELKTGNTPETHNGTINVTSNIGSPVSVNYDYYNDAVTVTYKLQSTHKIVNTQSYVEYDPTVLQLGEVDLEVNLPKLNATGSAVMNVEESGYVYINASNINLYNFTNPGIYYTQTFNIIGTGDTTVNLNMEILTGSDQADYTQATDKNDITLVDSTTALTNEFTFTAEADLSGEEPTTAEPTTEEPTTAEPTTAEPTTVEPTTAEPTTVEPTTAPEPTEVTLKLVAPTSTYAARYNWSDAVFFYGKTTKFDDLEKVTMTDTGEKFYAGDTFNSTIIAAGAWSVYTVTLTAEQAAAVDASKMAGFATSNNINRTMLLSNGNVFKAATGAYADYASTASSVSGFNGKTFIPANSVWGEKSSVSYTGFWTDSYVTVKAAAPMANTTNSRWDAMQIYYGDTTAFADMETFEMVNTYETTKVSGLSGMSIKDGRWYIYAVTLTGAQAEAVNAAKYAGFKRADGKQNRTAIPMNVLKAKTDQFDGTYLASKRTLQDVDGQVFIICGQTKAGTSIATYVGMWATKAVYTAGNDDDVTIYFAAPTGSKAANSWDTGVEFYYGNGGTYTEAAKLEMTKTNQTKAVAEYTGNTLVAGNWKVYSLTISAGNIREIDDSKMVGFVKKGAYNRTYYNQSKAVTRASTTSDNIKYGLPQSIETFDGKVFVIAGAANANGEHASYIGYWD